MARRWCARARLIQVIPDRRARSDGIRNFKHEAAETAGNGARRGAQHDSAYVRESAIAGRLSKNLMQKKSASCESDIETESDIPPRVV